MQSWTVYLIYVIKIEILHNVLPIICKVDTNVKLNCIFLCYWNKDTAWCLANCLIWYDCMLYNVKINLFDWIVIGICVLYIYCVIKLFLCIGDSSNSILLMRCWKRFVRVDDSMSLVFLGFTRCQTELHVASA